MRATRVASTRGKSRSALVTGCTLGLGNLLFVDTLAVEKAKEEKEYTAIFRAIMHQRPRGGGVRGGGALDRRLRQPRRSGPAPRTEQTPRPTVPSRCPSASASSASVAETGQLSNVTDAYAHPRLRPHRRQGRHHRVHQREHTDDIR